MNPIRLREATTADRPELDRMAIAMAKESPRFSAFPVSLPKIHALVDNMQANPNALVLVADDGDGLAGMLLGFVVPHFFSDALTASELVVYVDPEHRGGRTGLRLIQRFESWAAGRGAAEIVLGVSTEVDAERTAALYERLGYERSGFTTRKTLVGTVH